MPLSHIHIALIAINFDEFYWPGCSRTSLPSGPVGQHIHIAVWGLAYIENASADVANLWVYGGHFTVLLIQATRGPCPTALKADANWD